MSTHRLKNGLLRFVLWGLLIEGAAYPVGACAALDDSQAAQRELLLFDEPVVSTATKHPQSARDAPSSVTVITSEEIRRFGYRTLAEALRSVRGFYGSYDRNYSYIGVRGFLRPTDYNDRILLLVNGHTYNDDIYQSASLGPEFGIDLEVVDRIEIIRGPGSALYGGNALFAVVNVVTQRGEDRAGARPLVETGSFGRKRGQASVGHVFENGLDVLASGSILDVDGQEALFFPEFDQPETNNGVARDADAERALNFFLSARYRQFVLQGGVNGRDKHIPTAAYGTVFNDPGTKTFDGRRFADLLYTDELRRGVVVSARAFYDGYRYHGTYIYGGADRIKNEDLAASDWLGSEVRVRWEMFERNAVTLGSEYTYHPDAAQENFNLPGHERVLDDHRSFGTIGIYAQDEWLLSPQLSLVAGLRFDRYYDRLQQVSPRIGALWHGWGESQVKLLFGRAFRPPNLLEQYYAYEGDGLVSLSNAALDPERITTYEAVLEQGLWSGAQAVLALYRYEIDDLIDQVQIEGADPGTPTVQYQNVSSARANGAELELRARLPHDVALRASYAIQEARSKDGRLLSNSPKHLGGIAFLLPLPLGFEAGAELQVLGPRPTLARRRLGTVTIANLNLIRATPIPGLRFSAGLYNLFNQAYHDPGGFEHVQDRLRQDGFTFRVQLNYGF